MSKKNKIIIPVEMQLDIFENVFMHLIEFPRYRDTLFNLIEIQENIDFNEVDLKLIKLEIELNQKKEGKDELGNYN